VGEVLGEANCILGLGDIAQATSDHGQARNQYQAALGLYERIQKPYSIGRTHQRLARIAPGPGIRARHVSAAREAWSKIDRPDLLAQLDQEFGPATSR